MQIAFAVWGLGAVYALIRRWRSRRELRGLSQSWDSAPSRRLMDLAQNACSALGMNSIPPIRISEAAPMPLVLGVWRPAVVLPRPLVETAPNERLRDVLIHKCADIARRDPWVHLLQQVSAIVFWLHPGVHWLNRQVYQAREELCDNYVLRQGDAADYAQTLLDLAESCCGKRYALSILGLFGRHWTLEERIGGLLDPRRETVTRSGRGTTVVLTALFGSLCLLVGGMGVAGSALAAFQCSRRKRTRVRRNQRTNRLLRE